MHAFTWYCRGEVHLDVRPQAAARAFERAIELSREVDDALIEGVSLVSLASIRGRHDDPRAALRLFREVIAHWRRSGDHTHRLTTVRNLVELLARVGADRAAAELYGAVTAGLAPSFGTEAHRLAAAWEQVARRLGPEPPRTPSRAAAGTPPRGWATRRSITSTRSWTPEGPGHGRPGGGHSRGTARPQPGAPRVAAPIRRHGGTHREHDPDDVTDDPAPRRARPPDRGPGTRRARQRRGLHRTPHRRDRLRSGLLQTLAEHPRGLPADGLADRLGFDAFYTAVWCRSGQASGILTREGDRYRLAPHMDALLLDPASPVYVGGSVQVLEMPGLFDRFEQVLPTGERRWWDDCSPGWIAAVAGSGLHRLAEHYPDCELVGIDRDEHSIGLAAERVREAGVADRVRLEASPLEEMTIDPPATLVIDNISMHECRDIDAVTRNVQQGLEPGGWFVISDFPFPDTDDRLATVPGRLMAGVQFFEAQIDDQLLPRSAYDELLARHGFTELGHVELTPVHAVTWGRRGRD